MRDNTKDLKNFLRKVIAEQYQQHIIADKKAHKELEMRLTKVISVQNKQLAVIKKSKLNLEKRLRETIFKLESKL